MDRYRPDEESLGIMPLLAPTKQGYLQVAYAAKRGTMQSLQNAFEAVGRRFKSCPLALYAGGSSGGRATYCATDTLASRGSTLLGGEQVSLVFGMPWASVGATPTPTICMGGVGVGIPGERFFGSRSEVTMKYWWGREPNASQPRMYPIPGSSPGVFHYGAEWYRLGC